MKHEDANPALWTSSVVPAWIPVAYAGTFFTALIFFGRAQMRHALGTVLIESVLWTGALVVLLAAVPQRVVIGAEGVRVSWLFSRRVVRYADIRRAEPVGENVMIVTMQGELVQLRASVLGGAVPRAVLERLWNNIAAGAEEGSRGIERATLARSGRSTAEWRSQLRDLGSPGTYRQAVLPLTRLWTIAENPAIAAELRVAAAVAIASASLDEESRERLRKLAAKTVEPALRSALVRLSNASPSEIQEHEAALDLVSTPPR